MAASARRLFLISSSHLCSGAGSGVPGVGTRRHLSNAAKSWERLQSLMGKPERDVKSLWAVMQEVAAAPAKKSKNRRKSKKGTSPEREQQEEELSEQAKARKSSRDLRSLWDTMQEMVSDVSQKQSTPAVAEGLLDKLAQEPSVSEVENHVEKEPAASGPEDGGEGPVQPPQVNILSFHERVIDGVTGSHSRAQEAKPRSESSTEDRRKSRRVRSAGKCSRMKSRQGGRKLASRRKKGDVGNLWVPSSSDLKQLNLSLQQYWRRIRSLRGATSCRNLQRGGEMHEKLRREGADRHHLFGNALIDLYGKCDDAHEAWDAFCRIENKNVVSWNFMLGAFVNGRRSRMAIELFRNMESRGIEANAATVSNVVNACSKVGDLEIGRQIHAKAVRSGAFASSVVVGNSLISMYAKSNSIAEATRTFEEMPLKNRISWEQIISASAVAGLLNEALVLHRKMDLEGIKPNASTFVAALEACASTGSKEYGKLIHRRAGQAGLDQDVLVAAALVDMYARWGNFPRALQLFQTVKDKGLLPWMALIKAYVNERYFLEALTLFESMQLEGIRPDISTMEAVTGACAYVTAFSRGRQLHEQILESGMEVTSSLSSRLVEVYTRCEQLDTALRVFSELKGASYSSLVVGLAQHGRLEEAVGSLRNMSLEGEEPDQRTFAAILQGCSYAASLKETRKHFQSMVVDYEVAAGVEHYRAVIDTLGRQGRLSKMEDLIRNMPWSAGSREWLSLLAAAERSRDLERAKLAAKKMRKLDFKDHIPFEVMASVYVEQGMWDEAEDMVRKAKMNRLGDSSFIEVRGKLRRFVEGERSDAKLDGFLKRMKDKMNDAGWPLVESRLLKAPPGLLLKEPAEEEERHHSEKLALAFGILEGGEEEELRICNLRHRLCCDCHSIMKYASQVFWKRIVVRDASKFHHFQEGLCSCKDYW